jgi:hypothetical protein
VGQPRVHARPRTESQRLWSALSGLGADWLFAVKIPTKYVAISTLEEKTKKWVSHQDDEFRLLK